MKSFLFIILIMFIACDPQSFLHASKEERIERQKMMKARLIKCINENASEDFKEFVKIHEVNFRQAIAENKDNISKEDKKILRECRQKIIQERNEERQKEGL